MKNKIVIVGGASTYTPGIIGALVEKKDDLNIDRLVIHDIDESKGKAMSKFVDIYFKQNNIDIDVSFEITRKNAFKDAKYIFMQIRTGGLKMRLKDESIAIKHGAVGQETCGPGGFAFGLRSIKPMVDIIKDANKYCPKAWIINYSNPIAILVESVTKEVDCSKVMWICDMPISDKTLFASTLNKKVSDIEWDYFGLNHFGWFTKMKDKKSNKDLIPTLRKKILNNDIKYTSDQREKIWKDAYADIKKYLHVFKDYVPLSYLKYYFFSEDVIEKSDYKKTRAHDIINGRLKETYDLVSKVNKEKKVDDSFHIGVHGHYIVDHAIALETNKAKEITVNLMNNGQIKNLPDNIFIERPGIIDGKGLRFKNEKGIEISEFYKTLILQQKTYEKLIYDVYKSKSYDSAIKALSMNKTVYSAKKAKDILDDYIKVNTKYWPKLK